MPLSAGVIRPSGDTAVASTITRPAPPTAREPRCTRCQSFGKPSSDEYWHIGETAMRLRSTTSFSRKSLNRLAISSLRLLVLLSPYHFVDSVPQRPPCFEAIHCRPLGGVPAGLIG